MSGRRLRVAFVVQRCGDEIVGGAERLCAQTAAALARDYDVEILTTCARDARTWADAYAPGRTTIGGVPARRFSVATPRDMAVFDRLSERLVREGGTHDDEEAWIRAQGPVAPGLFAHLAEARATYDRVVFYSYLYATTYFGAKLVADRSILVPLAHEEWMLALRLFDRTFSDATAIAYLSEEERAVAERHRPALRGATQQIVGVGIEPPPVDARRFLRARGLENELFVCVGRVEEAKGTRDLIEHFCALQRADPRARTLVLIGPVGMPVPRRPDIVALGTVSERDKWDALAAAAIVCVPSAFESLSLAALEAWSVGAPVLANGASAVLIGQCRRANGGLWYANQAEFVELARTRLLGRAAALGASGRAFVRTAYTWDRVRRAFSDLIDASARRSA